MNLHFRPATQDNFDDVVEMPGPKRHPNAQACWCLTYRLGAESAAKLSAFERREQVFEMCARTPSPCVLAYTDDEHVIGWVGVARRSEVAEVRDEMVYPRVDGVEPWSIFCLRTRAGHRRRGVGQQLLNGAIGFARDHGAETIEAYPLDTNRKIDAIYAYPGLRSMFEKARFIKVADTGSVLDGVPRVIVRQNLN